MTKMVLAACVIAAATAAYPMAALAPSAPPLQNWLPAPPPGKCWERRWTDEFDGNSVDPTKWYVVPYQRRATGVWRGDHVAVHDGVLDFKVSRQKNGTLVTGGISSQHRLETTYGYFVMRAKLPTISGYRPGFWLSSPNINAANDPTNPTEIDIVEQPTRDGSVYLNLHWNGYGKEHRTTGRVLRERIDLGVFHLFAVDWSPESYRFYIDGELVWTSTGGGISTGPQFIRLGNEPFRAQYLQKRQPDDAEFRKADNLQIDYVRLYKLTSCG